MYPSSPACQDHPPEARAEFRCDKVGGIASRLCQGVAGLSAANCSQLQDEEFLRRTVQEIGLVHDTKEGGRYLYGDNAVNMLNYSGKAGLWQEPLQIAAALRHLATSDLIPRPITSYIELGVHTAWTCAFVAAFLTRLAWPATFRGAASKSHAPHPHPGSESLRWT
jgi:hypothetical protein